MIRWTLTEQQADQILNALGQRPFLEVNGLIGVLMQQAQKQQIEQQGSTGQAQSGIPLPDVLESPRGAALNGAAAPGTAAPL